MTWQTLKKDPPTPSGMSIYNDLPFFSLVDTPVRGLQPGQPSGPLTRMGPLL